MRYLLATAVLAFSIAGSNAFALADPSAAALPASPPAAAAAAAPGAQTDGPGTAVDSPDVAQWTARLIHNEQTAAAHRKEVPHGLNKFASRILARTTTIAKNLTHAALRFLGTPYVFGGTSRSGFDCSGFTQHVFAMLGVNIPRTADAQYYAGGRIRGTMKAGDLVFFQTYEPGPSHVGIYLGNGRFVHASSSRGVMVSHLSDSYWSVRYLGAKRVIASR
ncbi:MAG: C40 family peptidase [Candidatus Baltobacteraceae bacterium]